ncbi:MAG: RHS repeat protein [Lachnospiraceae bacterium]|nr:RHS repeat protein [Lachnospiraceae bacterium]MDE7271533.1 RHS repeat protein [Lachnospiraceae bacterium]
MASGQWISEIVDQEGYSETFRYDREGRMTLHTDRNGNRTLKAGSFAGVEDNLCNTLIRCQYAWIFACYWNGVNSNDTAATCAETVSKG